MFRIKTRYNVYLGILILLTNGTIAIFAQADELNLKDVPNGFKGTFKSGNQTIIVDSSEAADRSLQTKITNSEGLLLVEAIYQNDLVTITVSDVVIKFRTDKESIASGNFERLSQTNQEKLEAYSRSKESGVVRRMILEIVKQRGTGKSFAMKGIVLISLVLGDEPGFPNQMGKNKDEAVKCTKPKGDFIFASYVSPTASIFPNSARGPNTLVCDSSNCCGCCGVGCWGCTGCYTGACYAHDTCVDQHGHLNSICLALLPAAAVSIVEECTVS